ncbi:hypothetical protein WL29_22845 [Burkholderia ubonensis]|uniref:Uncharacterized protein n=1 Tax=Burkholderia ubonensis TaxID=101571 RepID=A0A106QDH1_9BURK|nr:hypothetical protein [Burkholderia ubonensis]KWA84202.1 hypothetical protein WL29_22845 [Burkholderia ubonensis]
MQQLIHDIQALASPWPVILHNEHTGVLRLSLPEGLHFDAAPAVMLKTLKLGLIALVSESARLLCERGWRFAGGVWTGPLSMYRVVSIEDGKRLSTKRVPWDSKTRHRLMLLQAGLLHTAPVVLSANNQADAGNKLETIAAQAARKSLSLRSTMWLGVGATYEFQTKSGEIMMLTPYKLAAFRGPGDRLKELAKKGAGIEPGYELLLTDWRGAHAKYPWRTRTGEVVTASIAVLKQRSLRIGFSVPENDVEASLDVAQQVFTWTLPDGTLIEATLPIFDAALKQVLDPASKSRRAPLAYTETGFSHKVVSAVRALLSP